MEPEQDVERSMFQNPQYLTALISATPPIVALPNGGACRQLREFVGISQVAMAAACQVGLSSVTRYESGSVTHSRALEHERYRSLLAAFLRYAQNTDPEFAASIRRQWPALKPKTKEYTA
jgi:hypothetical protein